MIKVEEAYFNIIKATYNRPLANIILIAKKTLKKFPMGSRTRQEYLISSLPLNIVLEALARTVRQEEEIQGIQIGKAVKVSLFA